MLKRLRKIGILGGSFNPIHVGHLDMADQLLQKQTYLTNNQQTEKQLQLDEVWFTPDYSPLLGKTLIDATYRLTMIQLALEGLPNRRLCDIKVTQKIAAGTWSLWSKLHQLYHAQNLVFYLIVGQDCLTTISGWQDISGLYDKAPFIIVPRKNIATKYSGPLHNHPHLWLKPHSQFNIRGSASSDIRERLAKAYQRSNCSHAHGAEVALHPADYQEISSQLPPGVLSYIIKTKLYQPSHSF